MLEYIDGTIKIQPLPSLLEHVIAIIAETSEFYVT